MSGVKSFVLFMLCFSAITTQFLTSSEVVNTVNNSKSTWTAIEDHNIEQFLYREKIKFMPKPPSENLKLPVKKREINFLLPDHFDLREVYPGCKTLQDYRDQSNCVSSWAFSTVEVISDRICIKSGQKLQVRISVEDVLACCEDCGSGCQGGNPAAGLTYWKNKGIVTGGLYGDNTTCLPFIYQPCDHFVIGKYGPCPDRQPTPQCQTTCNPEYKGPNWENDKWYAEEVYSINNNEIEIMNEIFTNGPVVTSFDIHQDFLNYKQGVYKYTTGNFLGRHSIKCIGWGVENGVKYWLMVNSWNEEWGENGTFRILRGVNHLGVEEDVLAGTPLLK